MADLLLLTGTELFLVALTCGLCVVGLLLPGFGNQIGKAVLGEDPEVVTWRQAWAARRSLRRKQRVTRRAERKARRLARRQAKLEQRQRRQSPNASG
ncbi:MAG TPA: hypothetical protein DCQ06_07525 [Myxococcales bacterium]|nr:hypothetical protein [Myxococcales bacterium]